MELKSWHVELDGVVTSVYTAKDVDQILAIHHQAAEGYRALREDHDRLWRMYQELKEKLNQAQGVIMMREATIEQVRDLADHDADRLREQLSDAQSRENAMKVRCDELQATIQRLTEQVARDEEHYQAVTAMSEKHRKNWVEASQRVATLEGALKRLEWEHDGENERYCTHCGGWESQGHLTGCWFAQALAPAPGQEPAP